MKSSLNFKSNDFIIFLLYFSCFFYGGLYQNNVSKVIGSVLFFIFNSILLYYYYIKPLQFNLFRFICIFYVVLSVWTIIGSPKPYVDTFDIFKQVSQKVLSGQNPYTAAYTKTYAKTENHFHYLPMSFLTTTPFSFIFQDPRYSIIFFNLVSAFLLRLLFKNKLLVESLNLYIALFLFLPRSFYMIEHMYLDPIIFTFFLLFYYFTKQKKYILSSIALSLFFSFKQNLIILLPIVVLDKTVFLHLKKYYKYFFLPFIFILVYMALNPYEFIKNTFLVMFGSYFYPKIVVSTPIDMALSFQVFIKYFFPSIQTIYLYGISGILLLLGLIRVVMMKNQTLIVKMFISTFIVGFFMHLSFYNYYYFVSMFYLVALMFKESIA